MQSKTIVADTDYDEYLLDKDGRYLSGNIASNNYKVKDFYGTWVAVKVRLSIINNKCDSVKKLEKLHESLGKKIVIKPNFYQNYLSNIKYKEYDNNAYFGKYNVFYSTENINTNYGTIGEIIDDNPSYQAILVNYKNSKVYDNFGAIDNIFIQNHNTLTIMGYPEDVEDYDYALYMLIREEEAKKIDKYTIYIPKKQLEYGQNEDNYCGDKYDTYAKKIESTGKYIVVRDGYTARNMLDIN